MAAGEIPAITLKNAASFAKFIVKNKNNEAITIKSVEMTAEGYNVVGQFYIKFAEDVVAYNPKSNSTLSTALLEVKSGRLLPQAKVQPSIWQLPHLL